MPQKVLLEGGGAGKRYDAERPGKTVDRRKPPGSKERTLNAAQGTLPDETGRLYHVFREDSNGF